MNNIVTVDWAKKQWVWNTFCWWRLLNLQDLHSSALIPEDGAICYLLWFLLLVFFLCSCSSSSFGCLFLYSAICICLWCSSWHFVRLSWGWSPNQGLVPLPKHHPEWCPGQNGDLSYNPDARCFGWCVLSGFSRIAKSWKELASGLANI